MVGHERVASRENDTEGIFSACRLIEELMALCGYSRKHAIKVLNKSGPSRVIKRSGPKPRYDARVREV